MLRLRRGPKLFKASALVVWGVLSVTVLVSGLILLRLKNTFTLFCLPLLC